MSVFDGDVLLARMACDALALGPEKPRSPVFQWTDISPDFTRVEEDEAFSIGPELVNGGRLFGEAEPLPPGVHLRFRPPRAFSHGRHDAETGRLVFPPLPNRWLVQRLGLAPASHRAWLIRSDAPGDPATGFAWPSKPLRAGEPLSVRRIGDSELLRRRPSAGPLTVPSGGAEEPAAARLTAIGPGDPFFAANYRASGRVLGFHDPMTDAAAEATGAGPVRFSYLVTGWFSAAPDDPADAAARSARAAAGLVPGDAPDAAVWGALDEIWRKAAWAEYDAWLAERRWSLAKALDASPPGRIFLHGLVRGVEWPAPGPDRAQTPTVAGGGAGVEGSRSEIFPIDLDSAPGHEVAVGETGAEALAALLEPGRVEQDLLAALQQGVLGQQISLERLQAELHARRFDSVEGGALFAVNPEGEAPTPGDDPQAAARRAPPLPDELRDIVARLNARQAECDRLERRLADARRLLYGLWRLRVGALAADADGRDYEAQLDALKPVYDALRAELEASLATRDEIHTEAADPETSMAELAVELRRLPEGRPRFRVTRGAAPPFHAPAEPTLAISGPAARWRNAAPAPDGACRRRAEIVDRLEFTGDGGRTAVASGAALVAALFGEDDPSDILDPLNLALLAEALLLDPDPGLTARVAALLAASGDFVRQAADARSRFGPAVGAQDWAGDPWIPLALVWKVEWRSDYASPPVGGALPADLVAAGWRLDDDGELVPAEGAAVASEGATLTVSGVSILTATVGERLVAGLADIAAQHPLIEGIRNRSAQVQQLAGVVPALLGRRRGFELPPLDYDRWLAGEGPRLDPVHEGLEAELRPFGAAPDWPPDGSFLPLRAGRMRLLRLSIVDAFGRTRKLLVEGGSVGAGPIAFRPARTVAPEAGAEGPVARFRPRLGRPARLRFDWDGDGEGAGPVRGWIVANWLEKGLAVHSADGRALGLLQKRLDTRAAPGASAYYWTPAPGAGVPASAQEPAARDAPEVEDPDLRHFVTWALGLDVDAGEALFRLFSEAVAAADERVPEEDPSVSTLLGRPFALARATLRIEAAALLPHRPTLRARDGGLEAMTDTASVEAVCWPLRLGGARIHSDGLVGLFAGAPDAPARLSDRFLPSWGRAAAGSAFAAEELRVDGASALPVLLLLDPQARVHATTGVLPRRAVELPPAFAARGRRVREGFFQTAPVLGFSATPAMPIPSDDYGEWSWAYRPDVASWRINPELVRAAERGGFANTWPTVAEGWLRLSISTIRGLSLWTREPPNRIPAGATITLLWSVQGASSIRLTRRTGDGAETPVEDGEGLPAAGELRVRVDTPTTFRIEAANDEESAFRELPVRIEGAT